MLFYVIPVCYNSSNSKKKTNSLTMSAMPSTSTVTSTTTTITTVEENKSMNKRTSPANLTGVTKPSSRNSANEPKPGVNVQKIIEDINELLYQIKSLEDIERISHMVNYRARVINEDTTKRAIATYIPGDLVVFEISYFKGHPYAGIVTKVNKKSLRIEQIFPVMENNDSMRCACGKTRKVRLHPSFITRRLTPESFSHYKKNQELYFPDCFVDHLEKFQ